MATKTYVLLPHTNSAAPIYRRVNKDQRVRLEKRPYDHAFLQITYQESEDQVKEGESPKSRTIRLKHGSDTIFQDEQIKNGLPANTPYTTQEKDSVMFRNGVLVTRLNIVQKFLDNHPQNKKFRGYCDAIKQPLFEEYDKASTLKAGNEDFRKRAKVAAKIMALEESGDLKAGQDLMIRLNGSFFKVPDLMEEVIAGLIAFLDNAEEPELDKFLSDSVSKDEEITILIGRAVNSGVLSFDEKLNQVSLKKNNAWVDVKLISSEHSPAERKRYFAEFLSSPDGQLLYEDLKKTTEGGTAKAKSKKETVNA